MTTGVLIVVVVGHELRLHVVDHLLQPINEAIEIFFVEKDLVTFVSVAIESFSAFGQREVEVVPFGLPHIEEISTAFAGAHLLRIYTLKSFGVSLVIHCSKVNYQNGFRIQM